MSAKTLKNEFRKKNILLLVMKYVFILLFIIGLVIVGFSFVDSLTKKDRLEALGADVNIKITFTFVVLLVSMILCCAAAIILTSLYSKNEHEYMSKGGKINHVVDDDVDIPVIYSLSHELSHEKVNDSVQLEKNNIDDNAVKIIKNVSESSDEKVIEERKPTTSTRLKSTVNFKSTMGAAPKTSSDGYTEKTAIDKNRSDSEGSSGFFTSGGDL